MKSSSKVVFLFDVDNTLLDNDRIENDPGTTLRASLELRPGIDILPSSRRYGLNWGMRTIWALRSDTGCKTCVMCGC
jgi:hypothetical protein